MKLRTKYFVLYAIAIILPFIFLIANLFLIIMFAKEKLDAFLLTFSLLSIFLFLGGFLINFWYATKIKVSLKMKLLASIFSGIGFVFLMGYNKTMIPALNIIKKSCILPLKNWKLIIKYLVIMYIPVIIFLMTSFISNQFNFSKTLNMVVFNLLQILSMLFMLWSIIALSRVIKNLLENKIIEPVVLNFKNSIKYLLNAFLISATVLILTLGGAMLFIVPGIIFSILFSFAFYGVIFENKKIKESLQFSINIVKGRWWDVAWRIFAPTLFFSVLLDIIKGLIYILVRFYIKSPTVLNFILLEMDKILKVIFIPFSIVSLLVLYINIKNTKQEKNIQI